MNKNERQLQELINRDLKKINLELENEKKKTVDEIKQLNKNDMFLIKDKEKKSFFEKLIIMINGKKR